MRAPGVLDAFEWYCSKCHTRVHRHELHVSNLVADIPKVFENYFTSVADGNCRNCGTREAGNGLGQPAAGSPADAPADDLGRRHEWQMGAVAAFPSRLR